MGAVGRRIKPNRSRPGVNDPGILASRKVRRRRHTARKEELLRLQAGGRDPGTDRLPCLFGDLELHRPLSLLLHDDRAWGDMTALEHIANVKPHQIAPAQLAVDSEIEQREFPGSMIQLQSNSDGPISFSFSGGFWPISFPLFHGTTRPSALGAVLEVGMHEWLLCRRKGASC